jgi:hypothetical protein
MNFTVIDPMFLAPSDSVFSMTAYFADMGPMQFFEVVEPINWLQAQSLFPRVASPISSKQTQDYSTTVCFGVSIRKGALLAMVVRDQYASCIKVWTPENRDWRLAMSHDV